MNGKVLQKILLGLRNNAHQVQLIVPNGSSKPVLGTSEPEEEQRRVNAVKHWMGNQELTRQQTLLGIKQPLEQRTQTVLYYQLAEHERQQINCGMGVSGKSRNREHDVRILDLPPAGIPPDTEKPG